MAPLVSARRVVMRFGVVAIAVWTCAASGAEFRSDQTVHIKADETIDGDLYVFGEHVTVEGTVKGDLIAAGAHVKITATVEGDVAAAGQTVLLEGPVGDDARLAGMVIKVAAPAKIKGDVLAAGLSFELEEGSSVAGELVVTGYQADLSGNVQQDVQGSMVHGRLAGEIGGDVRLEVNGDQDAPPARQFAGGQTLPVAIPQLPPGFTVASTAKIDGDLRYSGPREGQIDEGATLASSPEFTLRRAEPPRPPTTQEIVLAKLRHFIVVALLGMAMVLLLPHWSTALANTARQRPLASLLGGIAGIILFGVLLIVLLVATIVLAILFASATLGEMSAVVVVLGILSGIGLIGGFWLFTSYLAAVVVSLMLGRLIMSDYGRARAVVALLIGLVIVALLCSIPYAGPWIAFAVVLLGLGALVVWLALGTREPDALPAKA